MKKLARDRWGAPIFGATPAQMRPTAPQGQAQDSPDNVSGIGLLYPHIDRQTMGAEAQRQFSAHEMIQSAMRDIGEEPAPQGQ